MALSSTTLAVAVQGAHRNLLRARDFFIETRHRQAALLGHLDVVPTEDFRVDEGQWLVLLLGYIGDQQADVLVNLGGGKANSCSILEAFQITGNFTGKQQVYSYVDENRIGDHICYYSDLRKMKAHYPDWDITQTLEETIGQIVEAWKSRTA